MFRRTVLAGAGTALTGFAGCMDETDEAGENETPEGTSTPQNEPPDQKTTPTPMETPDYEPEGYVRPDTDPEIVPEKLNCDIDEFQRPDIFTGDTIQWGDADADGITDGVALRVRDIQYELGSEVHVVMRNVSDQSLTTKERGQFGVQLYTEADWENVFGYQIEGTPPPYYAMGEAHDPGEGFEWRLPLTEDELMRDHEHAGRGSYDQTVCPDLQHGRYRFVFWIEPSSMVAVGFDVSN